MSIRIVEVDPRPVEAVLRRLRTAFPNAVFDAELGRREARVAQERLRQMGRSALASLRDDSVDEVVFFQAEAGSAHISVLVWPDDGEFVLGTGVVDDGCWALAERFAAALGGQIEEE